MVRQGVTVFDPSDKTIKFYMSDTYRADPVCTGGASFDRIFDRGIRQLRHYPETSFFGSTEYLRVNPHNFPFEISKGLDPYMFHCQRDGTEKTIGREYWIVEFNSPIWNTGKGRQFRTLTKAIKFALNHYKEYLKKNLKKVEDYETS